MNKQMKIKNGTTCWLFCFAYNRGPNIKDRRKFGNAEFDYLSFGDFVSAQHGTTYEHYVKMLNFLVKHKRELPEPIANGVGLVKPAAAKEDGQPEAVQKDGEPAAAKEDGQPEAAQKDSQSEADQNELLFLLHVEIDKLRKENDDLKS